MAQLQYVALISRGVYHVAQRAADTGSTAAYTCKLI